MSRLALIYSCVVTEECKATHMFQRLNGNSVKDHVISDESLIGCS